jgi:hypothetical protein
MTIRSFLKLIFSGNFSHRNFSLPGIFLAVQLFLEKISEKIPDNIYPSSNAGFTMQEPVWMLLKDFCTS